MAYLVRIAGRAERDLFLLYEKMHASDSRAAYQWYQGLKQAILSLAEMPRRCSVTREDKKLRHLLYGHKPNLYRVIYQIHEKYGRVDILHIRHGARKQFPPSELK